MKQPNNQNTNTDNIFYKKYLKYKAKYLELKNGSI